jgi:hypothetical protein
MIHRATLLVFGLGSLLAAQTYTFTSLGVPFTGAKLTNGAGINDLGNHHRIV